MNVFKEIGNRAKTFGMKVKAKYEEKKAMITSEVECALAGTAAEGYIDTGVKILIAVVIGALLLALLYALFNDTVMPTVAEKVEELFDYAG